MRILLLTISMALSTAGSLSAQSNISNMSDSLDKNIVPASEEVREKVEKPANLSDRSDRNLVPAPFEERQQEEESVFSDSTQDQSNQQKNKSGKDGQ